MADDKLTAKEGYFAAQTPKMLPVTENWFQSSFIFL